MARITPATRQGGSGIVVEGIDATVTHYTRRANMLRPLAGAVVVKAAARAAQRMRDRVPVDEGDLLDSITSDDKPTFDGTAVYADAGPDPAANSGAFVGPFIEHGTVKMGPRPFVQPAGEDTLPEFTAALRKLA